MRRGFTLLELLLTLVLVTVGFTALLHAMSIGLFSSSDNESALIATQLAQEKMEELRNKSYAAIADEAKAEVAGFSPFQREVVVATPEANLKQVNVNVYWSNKADQLNTSLVTYVSDI